MTRNKYKLIQWSVSNVKTQNVRRWIKYKFTIIQYYGGKSDNNVITQISNK